MGRLDKVLFIFIFFISNKYVYSKSYLMQKRHKANQRLQKENIKNKNKNKENTNYKGEN